MFSAFTIWKRNSFLWQLGESHSRCLAKQVCIRPLPGFTSLQNRATSPAQVSFIPARM